MASTISGQGRFSGLGVITVGTYTPPTPPIIPSDFVSLGGVQFALNGGNAYTSNDIGIFNFSTTLAGTPFQIGDTVTLSGLSPGNLDFNLFPITQVSSTQITVDLSSITGSFPNGAYTGGAVDGPAVYTANTNGAWSRYLGFNSPISAVDVGPLWLANDSHYVGFVPVVGSVYVSDDGITWTAAGTIPSAPLFQPSTVVYGSSRYIIPGDNSGLYTSIDGGNNWSSLSTGITLDGTQSWSGIAYNGSRFVSVSGDNQVNILSVDTSTSNIAAYSDNGTTWTRSSLPQFGPNGTGNVLWTSVAYGAGKFVAVNKNYTLTPPAYSLSGGTVSLGPPQEGTFTFTTAFSVSAPFEVGENVTLSNLVPAEPELDNFSFPVISCSTTQVVLDLAGANPPANTTFTGGDVTSTVTTETRYSRSIATSTNGTSWTVQANALPDSGSWLVYYINNKFITIGAEFPSGSVIPTDKAAYSTDGVTWTAMTLPSAQIWAFVTYYNGYYRMGAWGTDAAAISTDGISWSNASPTSSASTGTPFLYGLAGRT